MILAAMGKPERSGEPAAQEAALREWGIPIAGRSVPRTVEGGDVVWLDARRSYVTGLPTNDEGIRSSASCF